MQESKNICIYICIYIYIYIYICIYGEMIDFGESDKISGKVNKSNTYNNDDISLERNTTIKPVVSA